MNLFHLIHIKEVQEFETSRLPDFYMASYPEGYSTERIHQKHRDDQKNLYNIHMIPKFRPHFQIYIY